MIFPLQKAPPPPPVLLRKAPAIFIVLLSGHLNVLSVQILEKEIDWFTFL